mgnify:FL=1
MLFRSPGALSPRLIECADLGRMQPGSVIVDVAIDQGGCAETSRPTTHDAPTYVVDGVVHYCVANIPGAVGRTSTYALCNATLPYVLSLTRYGLGGAARRDAGLVDAVNVHGGRLTNQSVAEVFGLRAAPFVP